MLRKWRENGRGKSGIEVGGLH